MTVRLMMGAPVLLLLMACPATPRDVGSSPADEETIWRTWLVYQSRAWLVEQSVPTRRMMVRDTTVVKGGMDRDVPADQALRFASWEEKRPEPGEKATPQAMLELARRLQAVLRPSRSVPPTALAGTPSALLPAEEYERLQKTCDTCGWAPFRRAHPGYEGSFAMSRVAFFRSFAMFHTEESTCGSHSDSLALMKFIDGKWTVAATTTGSIACGDCPENAPAE